MMSSPPAAILLMGPTGAGKTDLAVDLAERYPVEIISVDSAMVYRGMDIGTAKPSLELRERIAHHLIDIRNPADSYSVGQFLRDARETMDKMKQKGVIPLFAGGTMLYFHALVNGLAQLPESDPELRRQLDARGEREGWPQLHAELSQIDPVAAARIHPNDPQRIQRALEVHALTGAPMSDLQRRRQGFFADERTVRVVLCPTDRAVLHERIEKRFQTMMQQGFLDEVARLRARGDLTSAMPSIRAVGYRQLWEYLEGESTLQEASSKAVAATRQLAKRQLTWLRAMPEAQWFDPASPDSAEKIGGLIGGAAALC